MATVYKGVERTAALIAARSGAVDAKARQVQALAKAIAAKNADERTFMNSIKVFRAGRGLDRLVAATDPLAYPKEFGHVIRNEKGGPVLGYVRGLYVMARTYRRLPRVD